MKPWEYSPKVETVAQPTKLEVVQQTDDLPAPERHHLEMTQPPVRLPAILLQNLMAWVAKFHELRLEHPSGLILDARPEHIRDAVKAHPWGVVYDIDRRVLVSWGGVPKVTLLGLRDLETGELLMPEAVAA